MMKGIEEYKKNSHTVATNEQLVLRAFEKAITSMWSVHERLSSEDKSSCVEDLHFIRLIISELLSCLNHDDGGELTASLHQLYVFILRELSAAGFEGDISRLENAIAVAEQLYEGFFRCFYASGIKRLK
jgi:flagellar biosynthetic protein FliS